MYYYFSSYIPAELIINCTHLNQDQQYLLLHLSRLKADEPFKPEMLVKPCKYSLKKVWKILAVLIKLDYINRKHQVDGSYSYVFNPRIVQKLVTHDGNIPDKPLFYPIHPIIPFSERDRVRQQEKWEYYGRVRDIRHR